MKVINFANYNMANSNQNKKFGAASQPQKNETAYDSYLKSIANTSLVSFAGRIPHKGSYVSPAKPLSIKGLNDIKNIGQSDVLIFMAHPDDEVFFATIPDLLKKGYSVRPVYTTSGQWGHNRKNEATQGTLGKLRENELIEALTTLKINRDPVILGFEDGKTSRGNTPAQIAKTVEDVIIESKPKYIFSFGPDGITQHPDHITIGEIVFNATQKINDATSDREKISLFQAALTPKSRERIWDSMNKSNVDTDSWVTLKPTTKPIKLSVNTKKHASQIADSASKHKSQWTDSEINGVNDYYSNNPVLFTQINSFPKPNLTHNPWQKMNLDIFGKNVDFNLYLGNSPKRDVLWVQANDPSKIQENIDDISANIGKIKSHNYLFRNIKKIQYAGEKQLPDFKPTGQKAGNDCYIFEKEIY